MLRERIYGRYTSPARHVIVLAQSQAKAHHHHYIGTEHILLGICRETGITWQRAERELLRLTAADNQDEARPE